MSEPPVSIDIDWPAFLSHLAHELGTPVGSVRILTELIGGSADLDEKRTRHVQRLGRVTDEIVRLTESLRLFARLADGRLEPHFQEVTPRQVTDGLEPEIMGAAHGRNGRGPGLLIAVDAAAAKSITTDPALVRRILEILVLCGAQVSGEPVAVNLGPGEAGGWRFTIRDGGPPPTEQAREDLFSPFFRDDLRTARREGSTGLELPIARRIAELLGGRLTLVEGAAGATFLLDLPSRG